MDQNTEKRVEDAGKGSGVRFRGLAPLSWAIIGEETGDDLGRIALAHGLLTFEVAPRARGRGVATTAVREISRVLLAGRDRLETRIPWESIAAQRVALAAGYTREGIRRGDPELLVHSRLATDSGEPVPRLLPDLPGGELTDGVVTLRPLGPQDVDFYTALHSVPDVIATSVPPEPKPAVEIERRCARAQAHWLAGNRADLVIVENATGERAGEIDLYYQEPPTGQAMIGYSMLPAYRRKGLTSRAAQLLALWAFAETGIARLIAGTLPENIGSQRVLESAGFTREAYLRSRLPGANGTRTDDVQFVLLAGDLLAQASGGAGSHA